MKPDEAYEALRETINGDANAEDRKEPFPSFVAGLLAMALYPEWGRALLDSRYVPPQIELACAILVKRFPIDFEVPA